MTGHGRLRELLGRGDLDELVREIDRMAVRGDWDDVLWLRERCGLAAERLGKQLWGAAQYAAYRVALEAPGPLAASVVEPGAARFALGPLTEVVAQDHTWAELADHLPHRVSAAMVAQERVIRGEDLRGDERARPAELDLPLVLQPWEGSYPLPEYRESELLEGGPDPLDADPAAAVGGSSDEGAGSRDPRDGPPRRLVRLESALEDLAGPWASESTGEVRVATVEGDAAAAVAALVPGQVRMRPLTVPQAMARMAWAAASGGRLGRRRGLAAGRSAAWWAAHQVAGLRFPAAPAMLGEELRLRRWYWFEAAVSGDDASGAGWSLRLAVDDPRDGWAAAVRAHDEEGQARHVAEREGG